MKKASGALFLQQSYLDAWDDYKRSLSPDATSSRVLRWDDVILTASNEKQAAYFEKQIAHRQQNQLMPAYTKFHVLPDPGGKRVGSGGATLNALRHIASGVSSPSEKSPFAGRRVLLIHSGGDSKRVPQYSACGKLFSPVPRTLPDGRRSTLFDEIIIGVSGVPARIREGMLVLSGDVLLLFNPLQIEMQASGAAAISFKEDVDTGKDHGVYTMDEKGRVGRFLHKQSVKALTETGAVNAANRVDIDTGAVLLCTDLMESLYALLCDASGRFSKDRYARFVNETARLSFYGDFLYPLASQSTLAAFLSEKPEGEYCEELAQCRREIWTAIARYRMRLLRLSPAAFIHFGTTQELLRLVTQDVEAYAFLRWSKCVLCNREVGDYAVSNSVVSEDATIGAHSYLEDCLITGDSVVSEGSVLSHITLRSARVPGDVVLHGLKLNDGRFVVRAYGVSDNPKGTLSECATLLSTTLPAFLRQNGLTKRDLWPDGGEESLWRAALYPVCESIDDAVSAALNVCEMAAGAGDRQAFLCKERLSLAESFNRSEPSAIAEWETHIQNTVMAERLLRMILERVPCEQVLSHFVHTAFSQTQLQWLTRQAERAGYSDRMRILYYLGRLLGETKGGSYLDGAFVAVRDYVLSGDAETYSLPTQRGTLPEITVRLPLRVNFGGGWSDTPPYCNEHGGAVLNAAILLNGTRPVEVTVRRLPAREVVLESADVGARGTFTSISELQDCKNPYDAFALHKAALIVCGVLPAAGGDLSDLFDYLDGGLYLSTQVHRVPKGSGLGTSSILAGACVKALLSFLDRAYTEEVLYARVMCMEQMMSTGGGWQDQVGGLTNGIKFSTTLPGARQTPVVEQLHLSEETMRELNERFALIYTGQRRLARNLLRDVVGGYIGGEAERIDALAKTRDMATKMRLRLEDGDIDGFAGLLNEQWALSQRIDAGTTNTCIEQIFLAADDLISGRMVCGAGGGGFLQVVLKKGVSKAELNKRLHTVFEDCGVDVWDSALL